MENQGSDSLWDNERRVIIKALNTYPTQKLAAKDLGIDRGTLADKVISHDIVCVYMAAEDRPNTGPSSTP